MGGRCARAHSPNALCHAQHGRCSTPPASFHPHLLNRPCAGLHAALPPITPSIHTSTCTPPSMRPPRRRRSPSTAGRRTGYSPLQPRLPPCIPAGGHPAAAAASIKIAPDMSAEDARAAASSTLEAAYSMVRTHRSALSRQSIRVKPNPPLFPSIHLGAQPTPGMEVKARWRSEPPPPPRWRPRTRWHAGRGSAHAPTLAMQPDPPLSALDSAAQPRAGRGG